MCCLDWFQWRRRRADFRPLSAETGSQGCKTKCTHVTHRTSPANPARAGLLLQLSWYLLLQKVEKIPNRKYLNGDTSSNGYKGFRSLWQLVSYTGVLLIPHPGTKWIFKVYWSRLRCNILYTVCIQWEQHWQWIIGHQSPCYRNFLTKVNLECGKASEHIYMSTSHWNKLLCVCPEYIFLLILCFIYGWRTKQKEYFR